VNVICEFFWLSINYTALVLEVCVRCLYYGRGGRAY